METNDYCSYELSLALKKAGFCEPCDHCYCDYNKGNPTGVYRIQDGIVNVDDFTCDFNTYNPDGYGCLNGPIYCSAPTLWQAQKWLRETALLNIGATPALPTRKWQFYIDDLNQHINPHDGELMTRWDDDMQDKADERLYESFETAFEHGIAAALDLINPEKK